MRVRDDNFTMIGLVLCGLMVSLVASFCASCSHGTDEPTVSSGAGASNTGPLPDPAGTTGPGATSRADGSSSSASAMTSSGSTLSSSTGGRTCTVDDRLLVCLCDGEVADPAECGCHLDANCTCYDGPHPIGVCQVEGTTGSGTTGTTGPATEGTSTTGSGCVIDPKSLECSCDGVPADPWDCCLPPCIWSDNGCFCKEG